ncbi:MAG TPA: PEF-CTERM sorting domain-containing protein [Candidatus Methanoperedens sp.]
MVENNIFQKRMMIAISVLVFVSIWIGTASAVPSTGGPDYMGYRYIDSRATGGPTYDWIEINTTGTQILPSSDDWYVSNIPVGFPFNFYGQDYSQVNISNNGLVFATNPSGVFSNAPIGSTGIHNFIAPFFDDLVTWGSADAIYYQTLGTTPNRKFIVEWNNNQGYYSTPSGITFEAILYEGSNNILFQYKDVDFQAAYYNNGVSATVGIEGPTGQGLQYSYNEAALNPNLAILFQFPSFSGTNMYLSKSAPATKDHGTQMTYTLYYNNFGRYPAYSVILEDTLPATVNFVSASDGGIYNPSNRKVTWAIGTVAAWPSGAGSRTVTVAIPNEVAVGTTIQNTATISTTTFEERYDDNSASASTRVTGSNLPTGAGVGPTNSGGSTPSVYYGTPTTFTYDSSCATSVAINISINDGIAPIIGPMTETPPGSGHWEFTTTFYPRHGAATITYTLTGCTITDVVYTIWIDPAGYIYDSVTNARIAGATVTLQTPDGSGGWVPVPADPNLIDPALNPQTSDANGQYAWLVSNQIPIPYRVHVTAPGYEPADSRVVNVPPPVFDLNVGLRPIGGGGNAIPEFPSIALPIISIIGILFLISRKKN